MARSKKRVVRRSSRRSLKDELPIIISKKKIAMKFLFWILFIAAIIYSFYHIIVIDTTEGIYLILGIIILAVLIKLAELLYYKLKK